MKQGPFFIEKILQEAAGKIVLKNYIKPTETFVINFDAGSELDIITQLSLKDESNSNLRNLKYPLIAVKTPILRKSGIGLEKIRIPRIIFAHYSTREFAPVMDKFAVNEVFKNVLNPLYTQFLKYLAHSRYITSSDPDAIDHTFFYRGSTQVAEGLNDYVDILEILNMEFYLNNLQNCK